jgi:uncharacterized membrane protein
MTSEKLGVVVSVTLGDNGRSIVEIGYMPNQRKLTIKETCHILAGGISLLIKSSSQIKSPALGRIITMIGPSNILRAAIKLSIDGVTPPTA